jgi:hypothetical protein
MLREPSGGRNSFRHEVVAFRLEMNLRRVLTIVYLHAYQIGDPYDLLRDETVQPMAKERPTREQMQAAAENVFFHLTFGQYVGLNQRPEIKLPVLVEIIRNAEQYEALRSEVLHQPVEEEDDAVLLAGLKERMDAIEKMRNCVAHNRRPTRSVNDNYSIARPLLERLLNDYLATWEIQDNQDHVLHWETAAREAVENAMASAQWNEGARTITFPVDDEPPRIRTVTSYEELGAYLGEVASAAFYQNAPFDGDASVFECDDDAFVQPILEEYGQRIAELFG